MPQRADAIAGERGVMDLSRPLFVVVGLFLALLVALPLFWLGYYSLTDAQGHLAEISRHC